MMHKSNSQATSRRRVRNQILDSPTFKSLRVALSDGPAASALRLSHESRQRDGTTRAAERQVPCWRGSPQCSELNSGAPPSGACRLMQLAPSERPQLVCLRDLEALLRGGLGGDDRSPATSASDEQDEFQGDFSDWQGRYKRHFEWQPHEEASNDLDFRSSWESGDQPNGGRSGFGGARISVFRDESDQELGASQLADLQQQVSVGPSVAESGCQEGDCPQTPYGRRLVDEVQTVGDFGALNPARRTRHSFKVSADEAKRVFGAQPWISALTASQQRSRARHLGAIHSTIRALPARQTLSGRSQRRSELLAPPIDWRKSMGRRPSNIRLHRSDSSSPQTVPSVSREEQLAAQNRTLADLGIKIDQQSVISGAVDADGQVVPVDETPLECQMRRYTFKASKSDESGNKCSGQVEASICYGGCDSGEIADWIFPHKKSVHKVCTHGRRVRRRVILDKCSSEDVDSKLREYYFVDALNCVCKKCTSLDTTCLGSLTRPYLPSFDASAASSHSSVDADGGQQQQQSASIVY